MKALLWLILSVALIVNVSTSFAFDGVQQVLISVGTGLAALASGVVLFVTRRRRDYA
ncbi:hypothetical protein OKJ48_34175 [Streptomyces kunmingensis]|uniref:Uncharacterized protein n=1 Tax=Streptomyces kunmingensis TaxID=68225 RepID=A0ABU6CMQ9_9ACTN|nr:hypothetical protein [Streptomyces kunmingensis]MEB3965236.1 hypothetical protein [Streptomyces kunmingensis]